MACGGTGCGESGCYTDSNAIELSTENKLNGVGKTCLKCKSTEATIFTGGDGGGRFCPYCFRNNMYGKFKLAVTSNAMISPTDKLLVAFSGGPSSRFVIFLFLSNFEIVSII